MIYQTRPQDFNPRFSVAACYMEHSGKILLLHRHPEKSQGGKWGLPGGKLEVGETAVQAVKREVHEETGITIAVENITHLDELFVQFTDYNIVFNQFKVVFNKERPLVKVDDYEHADFKWMKPAEALKMNLVHDQAECIALAYPQTVSAGVA